MRVKSLTSRIETHLSGGNNEEDKQYFIYTTGGIEEMVKSSQWVFEAYL